MSRSSIRYIDNTYMYGHANTGYYNAPVSNPVIYAPFPKYSSQVVTKSRLNKFLSSILLGLVVLSLVSYYYVSDSEKTMNALGREIVALSNENIELQNKLDNLNSFNRVDSIIQTNMALDTASKVIEVPAVNTVVDTKIQPTPVNYNWSIGY